MTSRLQRELDRDRSVDRRCIIVAALITLGFTLVNALSARTEALREGANIDAGVPWALEITSAISLVLLLPVVVAMSRRIEWRPEAPAGFFVRHAIGSVAYSLAHVAIMVVLRAVVWPPIFGRGFSFVHSIGELARELIYEYRKDLLTYILLMLMCSAVRRLDQQRRELEAVHEEARASRRLTLKSGGKTMLVDADEVIWARAAGNYVEVHTPGTTHLARMTLTAFERLAGSTGVPILRVHRSWLVHLERIREIEPAGDGDLKIQLSDGTTVPGSRRHRDEVRERIAGLGGHADA